MDRWSTKNGPSTLGTDSVRSTGGKQGLYLCFIADSDSILGRRSAIPLIELMSLQPDEASALQSQVQAPVDPLRDTPHHRPQEPTEVMDYPECRHPIPFANPPEFAYVIRDSGAGITVPDSVEGMTEGILHLFSTGLDELNQMGHNALRAVQEKHSWRHRAQQILDTFAELRFAKQKPVTWR